MLDNVNFIYPIYNPAFLTATNVRMKFEPKVIPEFFILNLISVFYVLIECF